MLKTACLALVVAVATVAHAQAADYTVDVKTSTLTYHLVHKMHKVDATSHKVEGKARLGANGTAQVMVRVPSESFDSGNVNRDEHMKETVEAAKFPYAELKAFADGVSTPSTFPSTLKKTFKAQVTFHGVQNVFDLPVELTWESPTRVKASATFAISLDGYKVERPSLLFVKVDDELKIDAHVQFGR
jgi:polyisoprenoid-binding protein YceI